MITPSQKILSTPAYAFAEVDKAVQKLRDQGIEPIDFGVGDPMAPTPQFICDAAKEAIDTYADSGYPSYVGLSEFRQTIADWTQDRFGVALNPDTEITSTIGSKEAVFNFPNAFLDDGDVVLIPTPGYPPYKNGTKFANGEVYFYPLLEENNFFPDFSQFPEDIVQRAKILWICYPNSPTGKLATREFLEEAVEFCQKHNIILASDECYSEIYFDQKPISALEVSKQNVLVFHSLSKRSNMTGWRIGWVAGDPDLIATFKKLKTNVDSGTPNFVQAAAIAALNDEQHVLAFREEYKQKRDILTEALQSVGLEVKPSEGTFYMWQKVPDGMTSVEFATKLLDPEIGIVVTPGAWISDVTPEGLNPGEGYVRFALVPTVEKVREAAEKIKNLKIGAL